jgi:hypothetical protein
MKRRKILIQNLKLSFLVGLGYGPSLWAQGSTQYSSHQELFLFSKPMHEVATLGAPTTGSLVEGSVGSIHKGCRHRFYCHSSTLASGFLGPQAIAKPLSLKDQPGVFPAPLMGPASLIFTFHCQDESQASLTPTIVRPDGTIFQGLPMTKSNSPQTLVISSPAQTGIYTLFVLSHQKASVEIPVQVNASISTQPQHNKTFYLKSLGSSDKDAELISAEFVYTPSS